MTKYFNSENWEALPIQFALKTMLDITQITVNKKHVIELLENIIKELNKYVRNLKSDINNEEE